MPLGHATNTAGQRCRHAGKGREAQQEGRRRQGRHAVGGGHVAQQYLAAGLLDELELHVVPVLLGGGSRLLDNLGDTERLEQVRAVEAPGVTHLKHRITPGAPS